MNIHVRKIAHLALLVILAFFSTASAATVAGCTSKEDSAYRPLPGAAPFDQTLLNRFEEMRKQRGKEYHPRTKHLRPDGWARYTNRLFLESSPYLLQHAHNPVNWFPWGDEAFELARKLNRPVLVSIGYSTCHWCHVMEDESFEDEEIARYLNENFIVIKVDREERPDLDAIYMSAVLALTGRGGWPLNVWMTPDRKPFYGGTYFSPWQNWRARCRTRQSRSLSTGTWPMAGNWASWALRRSISTASSSRTTGC
jgi:hypothetical protein